jgi:hypothetical protein
MAQSRGVSDASQHPHNRQDFVQLSFGCQVLDMSERSSWRSPSALVARGGWADFGVQVEDRLWVAPCREGLDGASELVLTGDAGKVLLIPGLD